MRRFLAACLATALAWAPGVSVRAQVRDPGTYVHLTTRSWFTFDPAVATDSVSFIVVGNVYEPLITFKSRRDNEAFIPFLADQVPSRENGLISEDGLVYRFPIREGVAFHEGQALTPEDVRYSLLRFMLYDYEDGASALLLKPLLGVFSTRNAKGKRVVEFEAAAEAVRVEGREVVITLKKRDETFLKVMAALPIIVSREWAVANGEWDGSADTWKRYNRRKPSESFLHANTNGTGPYKIKSADAQRGQLNLARHEAYWRKPGVLETVLLRVVSRKAMRMWMLENGDADASYFEARDFQEASFLSDVKVVENRALAVQGESLCFTFELAKRSKYAKGLRRDFFADKRLRQAFAYAIDYERYFKRGMALRGARSAGPIPNYFLGDQKPSPYRYNLRKAEKLFKEAHGGEVWSEGFTLTIAYSPSNANRLVLAQLIKAGVEKINPKFKIRIQPMESRDLYDDVNEHKIPAFIAGYYADFPDAHSFAFGMLHSAGYYPKAQRYQNAEIDVLIERASHMSDPKERAALYRAISQIALEDAAQVYTYMPKRFTGVREWVLGLDDDQNVSNLAINNFPYFYAIRKG